jgi:hypothetical protein
LITLSTKGAQVARCLGQPPLPEACVDPAFEMRHGGADMLGAS